MTNSKYSNDLDGELDRLVFQHEDRSPNPSDWCCLREPSVREAAKELLEQTRTNTIDAAIEALPDTKGKDARYQVGVADCALNILKLKKG